MPRLTVPLIGDGTDEDPFRVDLPNYSMVEVDYERKTAIVDVPEPPLEESPAPAKGDR